MHIFSAKPALSMNGAPPAYCSHLIQVEADLPEEVKNEPPEGWRSAVQARIGLGRYRRPTR